MLGIQVKCITLKSFSCFIDEGWIQKDPEKLNCKDSSESVSAVAVEGESWILHLFFISIYGAVKTHPRLCKDWGIPHLSRGSGGEACQKPHHKGRRFEAQRLLSLALCERRKQLCCPAAQGCQQWLKSCQGAGCQWQKWAECNICFLWLLPKKERGTFCCFDALGWKALQGFWSVVLTFVLCCFPQPTSTRHLRTRAF